jgi:hypothetical protein
MKLLRYEDPETLIHTYGLSDDKFFNGKDPKYIFVVKENATKQDLVDKKHDIDHLQMKYDRVVL